MGQNPGQETVFGGDARRSSGCGPLAASFCGSLEFWAKAFTLLGIVFRVRMLVTVVLGAAPPPEAEAETVCQPGRHRNCIHTRMRERKAGKSTRQR